MAHESTFGSYSLPAAADFSAFVGRVPTHQYKFVVINSSGAIALAGAGVRADGILENFPKPAEQARFGSGHGGVRKIKLGGNVAIGDQLTPNGSGLAVVAVAGDEKHGKALRAGVAGNVIEMLWDPSGEVPA